MARKNRCVDVALSRKARVVGCPQMIDPDVDCLAYLLLRSLTLGEHARTGLIPVRDRLLGPRKPLAIVVTTDAVTSLVNDLRHMAALVGVPVVHALPRTALGDAMRVQCPLVVVAILDLPDVRTRKLLCALMACASTACGDFAQLVAGGLGAASTTAAASTTGVTTHALAATGAVAVAPCAALTQTRPEVLAAALHALAL